MVFATSLPVLKSVSVKLSVSVKYPYNKVLFAIYLSFKIKSSTPNLIENIIVNNIRNQGESFHSKRNYFWWVYYHGGFLKDNKLVGSKQLIMMSIFPSCRGRHVGSCWVLQVYCSKHDTTLRHVIGYYRLNNPWFDTFIPRSYRPMQGKQFLFNNVSKWSSQLNLSLLCNQTI